MNRSRILCKRNSGAKKRKAIKLDNTLTHNSIFAPSENGSKPILGKNNSSAKKRKPIKLDNTLTRNSVFSPSRNGSKRSHFVKKPVGCQAPITKPFLEQYKSKRDSTPSSAHSSFTTQLRRDSNTQLKNGSGPSCKSKKSSDRRKVVTMRTCTGFSFTTTKRAKWTQKNTLFSTRVTDNILSYSYSHELKNGGNLEVHTNLIPPSELSELRSEILNCGLFRQYQIQAQDEPRVHFLVHDEATPDDFETSLQPGYGYARICLKARPLSELPLLQHIAKRLAKKCGIEGWQIGINPVLMRDGHDKIGAHSDSAQGETVILCLVVASPAESRRVLIQPKRKGKDLAVGDENIELFLQPGDVYVMDGKMQESYLHSVPGKETKMQTDDVCRLSVVFRDGKKKMVSQDSGHHCKDISPKVKIGQVFGNEMKGLVEGNIYKRIELVENSYHRGQQSGVSGGKDHGADAIVVSGQDDCEQIDSFFKLAYKAKRIKGALALSKSLEKCLPVRVFRSTIYNSPYRAISPDVNPKKYRYDGVYQVVSSTPRTVAVDKEQYTSFELQRMDGDSNHIGNGEVLDRFRSLGTMNLSEWDRHSFGTENLETTTLHDQQEARMLVRK